ncbi:hypothetical protein B0T10DRAFT_479516 [Thelonectria olida]|uniref:DUF7728 domain-containing protein n=1 Tax=Thelonectria olida TaxID=1576542 RepID=A0A9P8WC79_9HYPO|nr:hypothetical protein B0T10DRAFT_479516 [Thelonectria olida]
MLFRQLLLAASATAFLVVPETSDSQDGIFRILPVDVETYDIPANALTQSLEVPCRQCRGSDTHLKLDFTVEDSKRLVLNGFELYPNADPWQGDLTAAVIKGNGKSRDRTLGYGLAIRPEGMDEDQKLEVIGLELLIIEVGDRFIDGVPPVAIKLIKALNGDILIGSISLNGINPNDSEGQCNTLWCRVSGLFEGAWTGVKGKFKGMGCHGKNAHGHGHKGHHHGQDKSEHQQGSKHHGDKTHDHHGKFGHKHHHHHEKAWSVVKHVASYIFLPVIMGMTAGVGVAVIAMFIGTLIARLIRMVRCGREYLPVYFDYFDDDEEISVEEFLAAEKAVGDNLAAHLEANNLPPKYEDEPADNKV